MNKFDRRAGRLKPPAAVSERTRSAPYRRDKKAAQMRLSRFFDERSAKSP
jgi:hypothetical protein